MKTIDRQGMIDALLQDDVRVITEDLKTNDATYLMFLLEGRKPYSEWTNSEVEESYNEMQYAQDDLNVEHANLMNELEHNK